LDNKFTYNKRIFHCAIKRTDTKVIKWLLDNEFPYDKYEKEELTKYKYLLKTKNQEI
jgi:hypothetical protein